MHTLILSTLLLSAFLLQYYFGYRQIKHFSNKMQELRKIGRVVVGKRKGKIRSGTIVMIAVNNEGFIRKAVKLQGVTTFSKFKELSEIKGKILYLLDSHNLYKNKLVQQALDDAIANYNEIVFDIKKVQKEKLTIKKLLGKVGIKYGNISKLG